MEDSLFFSLCDGIKEFFPLLVGINSFFFSFTLHNNSFLPPPSKEKKKKEKKKTCEPTFIILILYRNIPERLKPLT